MALRGASKYHHVTLVIWRVELAPIHTEDE